MSDPVRIVVADDHPLWREGVVSTLAAQPEFEIVGQGSSADEAMHLVSELLPDLILLDISMPGGGIEAARTIARTYPVVKIVMLTVSESEDNVLAALKAGARGYVLKGVSSVELTAIVRGVCAGETYITPALAASLLMESKENAAAAVDSPADLLAMLTERELQILERLAEGLSNKQIAAGLFLSEKTIKHYMSNILQKLQVRNRVEAALLAQKVIGSDKKTFS